MPIPLALAAIPAAIAVGGAIGGALSNKKAKTYKPIKYDNVHAPDQGLYQYGGSPGYADAMRSRFQQMGTDYGNRNVLSATSDADYRQGLAGYEQARATQAQSRGQALQNISALSQAAQGTGPSAAVEQMRAGTEDAARNALNVAATQRGGGVGATMAALDSNALAAQRANRDAAIVKQQEMARAQSDLAGSLASLRQGDVAVMQSAQGLASLGLDRQRIDQQQQAMHLQQMGLNDEQQRALLQGELAVNQQQMMGNMAYGSMQMDAAMANQGAQLQSGLAAQGLNANAYESYKNRMNALWGGLISGGAGATGAMIGAAGAPGKP